MSVWSLDVTPAGRRRVSDSQRGIATPSTYLQVVAIVAKCLEKNATSIHADS